MIVQIDEQISIEIYFDPLDREEGYDDDIRFAIHEEGSPKGAKMLAADEIGILLTPTQAEQMATALWQAAQKSRRLPWPGRARKANQEKGPFANAYPSIANFASMHGWIELGQAERSISLLQALDEGGSLWQSTPEHKTPDQALLALEKELARQGR